MYNFRILFTMALALLFAIASPLQAQQWPSKPIKIVVPYPPGGVNDIIARTVAQPLSEALGQPVVVDNRPGASGMVGTDVVASAEPNGYTLLMFEVLNTILPSIVTSLRHDPIKSFAPITILGRGAHVLVAHPSFPVNNVKELIAYAKLNPGKLSYASPGRGSSQHLSFEMVKTMAGIDMIHVPYKGGGQAVTDLVGGHVKVGVLGVAPSLPHIKAGTLRALAVTGATRSKILPEIPTVAESGLPGFESGQWQGIVAPAGTSPAIIGRLHSELVKVMHQPAVAEKMTSIGMDTTTSTSPEEFVRLRQEELNRWSGIVKAAGIKPE